MNEKSSMNSKKFIAYMLAELTWKAIILVSLFVFSSSMSVWAWWTLLAIVGISGFVEVVYIGKQADLDRYVRLAEIAAKTAKPNEGEEK